MSLSGLVSRNKAASLSRLEQVVGLREVKGGAHRPAHVWGSNVEGRGARQCQSYAS